MTVLSVDLAAERLLVDGDPVEISSTAAPLLLPFFSEPSFWSPADPSFRSRLLKLEVANFEDCKTQSMEEMRKLSKWLSVLQNLLRIHWRKIVSETSDYAMQQKIIAANVLNDSSIHAVGRTCLWCSTCSLDAFPPLASVIWQAHKIVI